MHRFPHARCGRRQGAAARPSMPLSTGGSRDIFRRSRGNDPRLFLSPHLRPSAGRAGAWGLAIPNPCRRQRKEGPGGRPPGRGPEGSVLPLKIRQDLCLAPHAPSGHRKNEMAIRGALRKERTAITVPSNDGLMNGNSLRLLIQRIGAVKHGDVFPVRHGRPPVSRAGGGRTTSEGFPRP